MVRAWYMDDSNEDQRLPHELHPPQPVTLAELARIRVEYFPIDLSKRDAELQRVRDDRGYTYSDELECSKEKLCNYEEKLKHFYTEHLHSDEEIRFVLEGSGYFDVRDLSDRWIRILVEPGDLLILPAGIYHRFTLDKTNFIHVIRLFRGEPIWTPINRPADAHEARKCYLQTVQA